MKDTLRTGEVAAEAGVNIETLRYYERRGLLTPPRRRFSGQRQYTPDAVRVIRAIKKAQALGFSLKEIDALLSLRRQHNGSDLDGGLVEAAREKLKDIEAQEAALRAARTRLEDIIARECDSLVDCACGNCPLEDDLNGGSPSGSGLTESRPAAETAAFAGPEVPKRSSRLAMLATGALAVLACSVCLLPGVLAGGLVVGAASQVIEPLASGEALLGATAVGAATLTVTRRSTANHVCYCTSE